MSHTRTFLDRVAAHVAAGASVQDAVRATAWRDPVLAMRVREDIGCWPSSEPALRELQRQ